MLPTLPHGLKVEQIRRYLENRSQEFEGLRGHLLAREGAQIRDVCHRMQGNAALYGLPEFGLKAGEVVGAIDRGDWGDVSLKIDELFIRLEFEFSRFAAGN